MTRRQPFTAELRSTKGTLSHKVPFVHRPELIVSGVFLLHKSNFRPL